MSARATESQRVYELLCVLNDLWQDASLLEYTKDKFLNPKDAQERLIAEGFVMFIFRITEEVSKLSNEAEFYGVPVKAASTVRNIIAHAYWNIDKEMLWDTFEHDFYDLRTHCLEYLKAIDPVLFDQFNTTPSSH